MSEEKKPHTYDVHLSYTSNMSGRVIALGEEDLRETIQDMFEGLPNLEIKSVEDLGESSDEEADLYYRSVEQQKHEEVVQEKVEKGENVIPFPSNPTKH